MTRRGASLRRRYFAGVAGLVGVAGAATLTAPAPAVAQTVVVDVTAAADGRALAGALATLLDADGAAVRAALTSPAGRAVLDPGAPGTYAVRVELIGHQATTSAAARVDAGETRTIRVTLATHAIPLAEIRVEAEGRCSLRPDEATTLGRVWEDARAALSVQAWTEAEGAYRLDLATWERDLDPQGRRVEREDRRRLTRVGRVPFASLPAERLLTHGFITRLDDGGLQYYGPDADLLLSDAFLDTHCFGLTRDPRRAGALGLTFAPERAGEQPDVRGVLWLDETSGALQEIEYGYTSAPYPEAAGVAGGRIEFDVLPNGAWVIDRWAIRAPLLGRDPSVTRGDDSGIRVIGVRETGGELERVSTLDGDPIVQTAYGSVRGTVWDSTSAAPLPGARVHLAGTEYEAATDSAGAFTIAGVPEGVFTADVEHPRLDSLGISVPGVEAEVPPGGVARVAIHVPSIEGALVQACGAVLTGRVLDAARGEPVAGARVSVRWQTVEAIEPALRARQEGLDAWTDAEGRYTACGVARDELLRVEATFLGTAGAPREVALGRDESHRVVDLAVVVPATLMQARGSAGDGGRIDAAGRAAAAAGTQGVQGRVLERGPKRPIPSAEVTVRSGSGAVVQTATADRNGFFRLQLPTAGRYLLSARALGYQEVTDQLVEVDAEMLTVVEIGMPTRAIELEPIVVTAEARSFHLEMEGFYQRRDEGLGEHITPEALERRPSARISDHFFGMAGVRVIEPAGGGRGRIIYFRSGDRADPALICWPMVYVDHHMVSTGGMLGAGAEPLAVDDVVHPEDVMAVEVYRTGAEVPSEFHGPNAGCGVVVLWTRRGGR